MNIKLKKMLPYLLIIILDFYLLPLFIKDTGSGMFFLLLLMPGICLICSIIYGVLNSFYYLYGVIVILLFLPTIFIYYNGSAAIYCIIYGILAFVGNLIGSMMSNKV